MIEVADTVFTSCVKKNCYRNAFKTTAMYGKIDYEDNQLQS